MHERYTTLIVEEVLPFAFDVLVGLQSWIDNDMDDSEESDDDLIDDLIDFIEERLDIYLHYIVDAPRSWSTCVRTVRPVTEEHLSQLKAAYQPPQRTTEWYQFRHNLLTASDIGKVMGTDSALNSIIHEKCAPLRHHDPLNEYVNIHSPMHWGQKYEPVTVLVYENMYHTKIHDYGCIQHREHSCIGASPDGINEGNERHGRMLEIKNIVNREITGIPLWKYWIQMQIQMEVCDLDDCDFVETRFKEYPHVSAVWEENDTRYQKGVILHFEKKIPGGSAPHYQYMPLEIPLAHSSVVEWISQQQTRLSDTHVLRNTLGWYLDEISCIWVPRNRAWFQAVCPKILETWATIERERLSGYQHREPKKRAPKLLLDVGIL